METFFVSKFPNCISLNNNKLSMKKTFKKHENNFEFPFFVSILLYKIHVDFQKS